MLESLLKSLSDWPQNADRLISIHPTTHGLLSPALAFFLALALAAGVFYLYSRTPAEISPARRIIMAASRTLFLCLILLILLRPALAITVATSVRQSLLILIDTSKSMQIQDSREDPADLTRAAIATGALDPKTPIETASVTESASPTAASLSRLAIAQAALKNPRLNLLTRLAKNYDLIPYTFDRSLHDLPTSSSTASWLDSLTANGPATAIGDALDDAIIARRGQSLAGILLITDGASNTGKSPASAALAARDEKIPIYAYGVGITSPKDVIVSEIIGPEVAFINDELPLTVRIRSQSVKGQSTTLVLKQNGAKVDEVPVTFTQDGDQLINTKFIPAATGDFSLTASIAPLPGEVVTENNESPAKPLRVIDGRIKVLHIEETPRWEFKYLQAMLLRDRRVDYKCLLYEADPAVAQGANTPYITKFPASKADLLTFDLVILGDVNPARLSPENLDNLSTFVNNFGGGLIVVAGKRFTPAAYRNTLLENMLPVDIDAPNRLQDHTTDKPIHLEITAAGKASPMMQLSPKDLDRQKSWDRLPPIYWDARVARPKPAADVLLVDPDPSKASRFGKMPVIALQQYGKGQVLFVGTDNTWRWRRNEQIFPTLWGQIVERMSLPHMLGLSKRTQLSTDQTKYSAGDRVAIYARLYREKDFEPIAAPTVQATCQIRGENNSPHEITLRQLEDQPGIFRGEFIATTPGNYQLKVATDPDTSLDFLVTESKLEVGDTALNEPALREIAEKSGGLFIREENLDDLPNQIHHTQQPILSTYDIDLWSTPAYFMLMLIAVTMEWWLRKKSQLK